MRKSSGDLLRDRFTKAFDENYAVMFHAIHAKVGGFEEAEEICQELFLRLYERMGEVANPKAWLYGALKLVVLEHYRKKGCRDGEAELVSEGADCSFVPAQQETALLLQEALEADGTFLSDLDRTLFELVAVDGYSYAEAARGLGISYRQARYGFECVSRRIVSYLKSKGISNLEEML